MIVAQGYHEQRGNVWLRVSSTLAWLGLKSACGMLSTHANSMQILSLVAWAAEWLFELGFDAPSCLSGSLYLQGRQQQHMRMRRSPPARCIAHTFAAPSPCTSPSSFAGKEEHLKQAQRVVHDQLELTGDMSSPRLVNFFLYPARDLVALFVTNTNRLPCGHESFLS